MIIFNLEGKDIILEYIAEGRPVSWVDKRLDSDGYAFNRTFFVSKNNLIRPTDDDDDNERRRFVIGRMEDGYQIIHKRVLGMKHDLLVSESIPLTKKLFVATGNISIFSRIDQLINEQVVLGGDREGAIDKRDYIHLVNNFPTPTELSKYADARVARDLGDYFETMSDAESRLVKYTSRVRGSQRGIQGRDTPIKAANELELEKYIFLRDQLEMMLADSSSYIESRWQEIVAKLFMLIFPQYIAVLEKVSVKEWYSNPAKFTRRYFDLALVDANGCVDLIEIKRPTDNKILAKRTYRHNYVPHGELSGAIMQAEKYLFYLSKSGRGIEKEMQTKYSGYLPVGVEIKVANPKAIILSGRDNTLSPKQKLDLSFIRKKYSNMIDILTYDDLLRRINNIINMLKLKS